MIEITIVLSFVFVTIMVLVAGFYYSRPQTLLKQRVERVFEETNKTRDEELRAPFLQRVLAPVGGGASRLLHDYMPVRVMQRTQARLVMANLETRLTAPQFQGFCWISGAVLLCFIFFLLLSTRIANGADGSVQASKVFLYLIAGTAGGYIFPQFLLSSFIQKRQAAILLAQPYALDLLSITVEAGLGFDASLAYAMRKLTGPLAEEFAKSLNEIRLGKPRLEALEDLGSRTGVEDLKIFMTAIVHASRLGSSITNTLRIQAESLRTRRRQQAQEMAMKAPVKMTFPLVLCIFPALLLVVLAPGMLRMAETLFK
ncbi:MAG: type II secretion system F family protein [Verrucomicrobiota bacterium]|jgi:tight adherence protein C